MFQGAFKTVDGVFKPMKPSDVFHLYSHVVLIYSFTSLKGIRYRLIHTWDHAKNTQQHCSGV